MLALLRARTKFDFRCYRKRMLARRLERRMGLSHFDNVAEYLAHLREQPEEVKRLARDLLISVTRFFRDPDAFSTLETEVDRAAGRWRRMPTRRARLGARLRHRRGAVFPGHAVARTSDGGTEPRRLQIFATDVDEQALEVARRGIYPEAISADVSPERLARFFTRVDESAWQISKQVRETVTFAVQNLVADAPFSRMDLISCRNVLIYLEPEMQKKIIALLHFCSAKREGTCSWARRRRLAGKPTCSSRSPRNGGFTAASARLARTACSSRRSTRYHARPGRSRQAAPRLLPGWPSWRKTSLLRRFRLACVVINRNYEVLHFAGPTEDYLVQPAGPPTQHLLSLCASNSNPSCACSSAGPSAKTPRRAPRA